jgi:hypothetical protein
MLRSTTDDSVILNAANQIGTIILNLISESTGDATYEQVISYMRVRIEFSPNTGNPSAHSLIGFPRRNV